MKIVAALLLCVAAVSANDYAKAYITLGGPITGSPLEYAPCVNASGLIPVPGLTLPPYPVSYFKLNECLPFEQSGNTALDFRFKVVQESGNNYRVDALCQDAGCTVCGFNQTVALDSCIGPIPTDLLGTALTVSFRLQSLHTKAQVETTLKTSGVPVTKVFKGAQCDTDFSYARMGQNVDCVPDLNAGNVSSSRLVMCVNGEVYVALDTSTSSCSAANVSLATKATVDTTRVQPTAGNCQAVDCNGKKVAVVTYCNGEGETVSQCDAGTTTTGATTGSPASTVTFSAVLFGVSALAAYFM